MGTVQAEGGIVMAMSESRIQTPKPRCSRTARGANGGRRAAAWGLLAAVVVSGLALGGCGKALFPETEPRTQFDRYDRSRDEYAPTYIEDEFGRRQPNLTGRLSPKR